MHKMVKRNLWGFLATLTAITVTIFFVALFSKIWQFITDNSTVILIITSSLITLFWIIGVFEPKRFSKSFKRRFK